MNEAQHLESLTQRKIAALDKPKNPCLPKLSAEPCDPKAACFEQMSSDMSIKAGFLNISVRAR